MPKDFDTHHSEVMPIPVRCDVAQMPKVANRLRKMAVRLARSSFSSDPFASPSELEFQATTDALFLLEAADLIDSQYEALRPRTARERGQMKPWVPAVISRVVQRVAGRGMRA